MLRYVLCQLHLFPHDSFSQHHDSQRLLALTTDCVECLCSILTLSVTLIIMPPTVGENVWGVSGCSGVVVEYRTRNREVAGSTHTLSTAGNLEQVANLLCAQANSASYHQRDGK